MSATQAARRPAWDGVIEMPVRDRLAKPRESGWTMVIDKGLGLNAIDDLMQVAAPVIDVLKLTFGTSAFFGRDVLKEKVRTVTAHGVYCMPGGTFQEVAVWQGALDRYLDRARELGFNAIEVSDGTIEMDAPDAGRCHREGREGRVPRAVGGRQEGPRRRPADGGARRDRQRRPRRRRVHGHHGGARGGQGRRHLRRLGPAQGSGDRRLPEGRARSRPHPLGGAARAPAAVPRPPLRVQREPGQRRARGHPRPRGAPLRAPGRHPQARVAGRPASSARAGRPRPDADRDDRSSTARSGSRSGSRSAPSVR